MAEQHSYTASIRWTGNHGTGNADYKGYGRDHLISINGKPAVEGSSDPAFRGDAACWNPEDMLVSSISTCHMLWFLHVASVAGVIVETYEDTVSATMVMNPDGSGQFSEATLHPHVTISAGDPGLVDDLHHKAHEMCFIARSLNFEIRCVATVAEAA